MNTLSAAAHLPPQTAARPLRRAGERGVVRRLALGGAMVALPLQDHLPPIFGFSVMYLAFAFLALLAALRPNAVLRSATRGVFVMAWLLLGVTFFIEAGHPYPSYVWWSRMAQMFVGGVIVASLIRTERDINAMLVGLVLSALWVSAIIIKGAYGAIASAGAVGFYEASLLRVTVLSGIGLRANWNTLAFISAGAAGVAVFWAVMARSRARTWYALAALACVFTVFLTFSRSGAAALLITVAYVLYNLVTREAFWRVVRIVAATALLVTLAVPSAVFQRFTFSLKPDEYGSRESRARIYVIAFSELPGYYKLGVGEGNYWENWADIHDLTDERAPIGVHSSPLQVLVYWGLPGFLGWMGIWYIAWRTLIKAPQHQLQRIALKAFCLSVFLMSLTSHDISDKQFSVVLGLIVGAAQVSRMQVLRVRRARRMRALLAARARVPDVVRSS